MQVKELEDAGLKKAFQITVEGTEIDAEMETELKAAGDRVRIPGFRPGNIPMKVLRQRFGKNVQGDVIKTVINRATTDLVRGRNLRPAMQPKINVEQYEEGGALVFTVDFETFPDTPDMDFSDLTLNRNVFEIAEKDIDEAGDRIAERMPKMVAAKDGAKAENENVVTIDFKGSIDGTEFAGGSSEDFKLELGSGQFIAGFEEQLLGVKKGDEVTVKVKFPDDYPGAEVAGKDAEFLVNVKEIETKEKATLNDEFAKERGFESLEKLREAIKDQLQREYSQVVRNQLKKELFDAMENKYDFELPESMVEMEFSTIWERLKQARDAGDESIAGKTDDALKEEYTAIARRRVKLGLMLAEVGNKNNLEITQEELSKSVMQQASQYPGQEQKVMEFYQQNPERLEELRGPILEEKAVDFILGAVTFKDHKTTLAELDTGSDDDSEEKTKKKAAKSGGSAAKKTSGSATKKAPAKKKSSSDKE